MGKFKNVAMHPGKDTLFQEEINVVTTVLDAVLRHCYGGEMPPRGTFILDGQKEGQSAKCILRLNLPEGEDYRAFSNATLKSDHLASQAIDEILSWPESSAYQYQARAIDFGKLPTGIYTGGYLVALVLNTTFGRFVASFQIFQTDLRVLGRRLTSQVLVTIAETLCQLGKEDLVLQAQTTAWLASQNNPAQEELLRFVRNIFTERELPGMETWHLWHEHATQKGELAPFFD